MLIFGTNKFKLKHAPFKGHRCVRCDREETAIKIFGHYFHIFFIPIFPLKKSAIIGCKSCKHINAPNEVDQSVKDFMKSAKQSVKQPWYAYSGSMLLFLIVLGITISSKIIAHNKTEKIMSPEVGDVHLLWSNSFGFWEYSYQKVIGVNQDSIWVVRNQIMYEFRPYRMATSDSFDTLQYGTKRSSFANENKILRVYRDYKDDMNFR